MKVTTTEKQGRYVVCVHAKKSVSVEAPVLEKNTFIMYRFSIFFEKAAVIVSEALLQNKTSIKFFLKFTGVRTLSSKPEAAKSHQYNLS